MMRAFILFYIFDACIYRFMYSLESNINNPDLEVRAKREFVSIKVMVDVGCERELISFGHGYVYSVTQTGANEYYIQCDVHTKRGHHWMSCNFYLEDLVEVIWK